MSWDSAVLAVDADLTNVESRMPELGKGVMGPAGLSAYDGKRALAKRRIGKILQSRGMNLEGIKAPAAQLKDPAVFLELALIFRDMAMVNDAVAGEKADYYEREFEEEMDLLALDYEEPGMPEAAARAFKTVPLQRA